MMFDINHKEENIIEAVKMLVSIDSTRDIKTKQPNAPFGKGIREAMDVFLDIASEWGFRTGDCNGYAVYAEIGPEMTDHIGVLGHLDIVSAGDERLWSSNPFELTEKNGYLYARGINDDKGPLIAALWAARAVYETGHVKIPIRVIAGGAEETTWECMDEYFKHHPQPIMGFSPDGNFPIVNGEMGMIQIRMDFESEPHLKVSSEIQNAYNCHFVIINDIEATSDVVLSRNPQRSDHAIFNWISKHGNQKSHVLSFIEHYIMCDFHGKGLGINSYHQEMGECNVCILSLNTKRKGIALDLDIRYPISTNLESIMDKFEALAKNHHFTCTVLKHRKPLYVSSNHPLIQALKSAYEIVMDEPAACITKGGASYARVMDAGVAFGATFEGEDPKPHMPNETMSIASLMKATDIYIESLKRLSNSQ